jgi:hypothetical protein
VNRIDALGKQFGDELQIQDQDTVIVNLEQRVTSTRNSRREAEMDNS